MALELVEQFGAQIGEMDPKLVRLAERGRQLRAMADGDDAEPLPPPSPSSSLPWWVHQLRAYWFVRRRFEVGATGAGVFLPMGSGKSRVAIGIMDWLVDATGARSFLVVGPWSAVGYVWPAEISKHGATAYQVVVGSVDEPVSDRVRRFEVAMRRARYPVVVLVNYEAVLAHAFYEWAMEREWDLIIADESHRIKAADGKRSRAMFRLAQQARYRLALTGTPLHHRPVDIWAQYRFLDPGCFFESYPEFEQRYGAFRVQDGEIRPAHAAQEFTRRMRLIGFTARTVDLQVPPVQFLRRYTALGAEARRIYEELEHQLVADIGAGTVTANNLLTRLIKLQEVTSGFVVDDMSREHVVDRAKEELLADVLEDLPPDEPVVVFGLFRHDHARIRAVADRMGIPVSEVTGSTKSLDDWYAGRTRLLIVAPRVGSEALDLSRARYAIAYSLGFSAGDFAQAVARLARPSQTRPVVWIHLLVQDTVDTMKLRYLEDRREVVEALLAEYQQRAARHVPPGGRVVRSPVSSTLSEDGT